MLKLQNIRRIHVELTTRCNARCPMCMRNYRGVDYNSGYPDTELSLDQFKHIVTPTLLKQLTTVNFNGNLGDFSLARDALEIVEYVTGHGVQVFINTNGSLRPTAWWHKLANPLVNIGFAIDGLEDTHALYRQDTNWNRVIENAQSFISAGGNATWRFVPFDHNRHQEAECRAMATEMGFKKFENIYDGRDTGPVYTRSGEFSHWLGKPQPEAPPISAMLESHVTWFKLDMQFDKDTPDLNLRCVHKKNQEIYIAADGSVYPCCYLGFYPGQMHHAGNSQLTHMVQENNALTYSLEHCMSWFDQVEETWNKSSIKEGRLYQCVNSCNQV